MFEETVILGIYAVTDLHAGSGSQLTAIDLPIQRERHTQFPIIWGQSLKGSLRARYKNYSGSNSDKVPTKVLFGHENADENASSISVGDAKLLLFPVRSLKGVFAYVTAPLVLERYKRDLEMSGFNANFSIPQVDESEALVFHNTKLKVNDKKIVLEDLLLDAKEVKEKEGGSEESGIENNKLLEAIVQLYPYAKEKGSPKNELAERLVIVNDSVFQLLVTTTTELVPRIKIDPDTGIVESGPWYEEYLPSDSLLYSVIGITGQKGKNEHGKYSSEKIKESFSSFITDRQFITVGGNITVGKGFVKLCLLKKKEDNE